MWLLLALVLVLTAYKSDSASLERPHGNEVRLTAINR